MQSAGNEEQGTFYSIVFIPICSLDISDHFDSLFTLLKNGLKVAHLHLGTSYRSFLKKKEEKRKKENK